MDPFAFMGGNMNDRLRVADALLPALFVVLSFLIPAHASAGTLVVANKAEASVSLIDHSSGDVVATLETGQGPHEVGISPDGRSALVTNYGTRENPGNSLTLLDIPAARVTRTIDLGDYRRPHGVEWLDDRRAAITVEDNRALIVLDTTSGEVVQAIDTDQDVSHMVALPPTGDRAYVTNIGSGSLTVIDLGKGERVNNIATGDGAEGVAVTSSGHHVWVTNRGDDTIRVLDTSSLETVREIPSEGFPIRATATPDGLVLVTRARGGDLAIYDAASMEAVHTVSFDLESLGVEGRLFGDRFGDSSVPIGVVVDDTGTLAFVAHANADVITEIHLETGQILRMLTAGKEPDGMGFSPLAVER
jgi:YVTN family beta-propeller protein